MSGMNRHLAVVLLSGGLDSCVTAALAARDHELALLHASYGQRTAARERRAFEEMAEYYGVASSRQRLVDLRFLGALGHSALTDLSIEVPEGAPGDGVPVTYVPFRNAHLLCAAVSWAELLDASSIWIGAVEEDSSGYPDCRESFLAAFERTVQLGTATAKPPRINAPLIHMRKADIVRCGHEIGAPLHLSWSCYQASDHPCGRCESCWLRAEGFREAGLEDPQR